MSDKSNEILKSVTEKLEAECIPVPPSFKGKLSEEDSLLLHVFLDHLYMQVLANLRQARKELEEYGKESPDSDTAGEVFTWLGQLVDTLEEGYEYFADAIEAVPTLETMKAFQEKLQEELAYAASISLEQLGKNGNGN